MFSGAFFLNFLTKQFGSFVHILTLVVVKNTVVYD